MEYLIGSLDDDGLLRKSLESICDELAIYAGIESTEEELEEALCILQDFDPAGIGARNLQECLMIQILRKKSEEKKPSPILNLEERIISDCYEEFTRKHWEKIIKKLDVREETFNEAIAEITKLNPRPGASLGETIGRNLQQIVPDFLVDTYDVEQGIRNAITVGLEMRERGERLAGIRIDSGDLSWLSKMARRMLDEAGLTDCGIVLSNDLDEYTIQSMLEEGADVMSFGVGTKLASAYDQPTLGGVYKLAAVRAGEDAPWTARLKISESAAKLTTPGVLDVRRYYQSDGRIAGDMVFDVNETPDAREVIVDPMDDLRQKNLSGLRFETLLRPLARAGKVVLAPEDRSAMAARPRACVGLETLDETQLRMLNPHTYPVGLELGLNERRRALVAELRHIL